jgi:hypothetical protein
MFSNAILINDKRDLVAMYDTMVKDGFYSEAFWWGLAYFNAAMPLNPILVYHGPYIVQILLVILFSGFAMGHAVHRRQLRGMIAQKNTEIADLEACDA